MSSSSASAEQDPGRSRSTWVILAAAVAAGFVFRLYHVRDLPAWGDEYWGTIPFLRASTWREFLDAVRAMGSAQAPGFPALLYAWRRAFGDDLATLRLLSVVLGTATIPLVFAFGHRCFDRWAGLVAAWALAFSPMHHWYSQSVRPYVLTMLLATLSLYTLVRAVREGGWPFWTTCPFANTLMVWTHWMALFVVACEGVYLLSLLPKRPPEHRRVVFAWAAIQLLLLLPCALYLLRYPPENLGFAKPLPMDVIVSSLLGEAVPGFTSTFLGFKGAWLPPRVEPVGPLLGIVCLLSALFLAASLAWLLQRQFSRTRSDCTPVGGLLLLIVLLPTATLAILNHLTGTLFLLARYVLFAVPAKCAALGGWIATRRNAVVRSGLISLLLLSLLVQGAFLVREPTRTDWRRAAEHIREHASSDDLVAVDSILYAKILAYHMPDRERPLVAANNLQCLVDLCALHLAQHETEPVFGPVDRSV
ncbi:MAG TPA: hypothetical protein ENN80_04920, partial [Candidatus Hydrogenedentes bacterium]|nr:hypothetical protein [Candidatus Hydrogenedentota bacterium]